MSASICLIIPPSIFLLDERVFPSLGILKIAAVLEKEDVKVDVLDLSGIENYLEALKAYCKENEELCFGLTTTTPQMPSTRKIIETIRYECQKAKIILGGPHVTLVSAAVKLEQKKETRGRAHEAMQKLEELADVLVAGDGEKAIFEALSDEAEGCIDSDETKSPLFMQNEDYEKTPWPARHLIDLNSYRYKIEDRNSTSLIAQLGCPFNCGFCGGRNARSLRFIRTRSTMAIVKEIEHLHKTYGFTGFMFYDDELNVNKEMVELMNEISQLQKALKTEFRLRGFVKSELFTPEQAEAMYNAGFRWLLTGFESGAPRILENINKKATLEDNSRAVEIAHEHGLKVKALMSVGHPGESDETILQTREWLLQAKPDDFDCTIITTYPGTPYYDEATPHQSLDDVYTYKVPGNGDQLHAIDVDYTRTQDYYKGDPDGGYKAYVFTDFLSQEELVERRNQVERSVREALGIPFNPQSPAKRYEHSMGQSPEMPSFILRSSK